MRPEEEGMFEVRPDELGTGRGVRVGLGLIDFLKLG
jgi:hypothetical protein